MKFRLLSDLHLEFEDQKNLIECGGMQIPPLPRDNKTVLVLAGDIALADRPYTFKQFIIYASKQFKDVIWILGNHEFYHTSLVRAHDKIKDELNNLNITNVHILERETMIVEDTAFICTTMWTDMDYERNPATAFMIGSEFGLNDFKYIRNGTKKEPYKHALKVMDCVKEFKQSKMFIFEELRKHIAAGLKTVVVTHHGPSYQSVAPEFQGNEFNPAYVSELGYDMLDVGGPNVWVHGHVHNSFDYMIGDVTRVVTNPRGYIGSGINARSI